MCSPLAGSPALRLVAFSHQAVVVVVKQLDDCLVPLLVSFEGHLELVVGFWMVLHDLLEFAEEKDKLLLTEENPTE